MVTAHLSGEAYAEVNTFLYKNEFQTPGRKRAIRESSRSKKIQISSKYRDTGIWLWLELSGRSFEGLEATHRTTAGNGAVGDLNNSAHS